MNFKAESKFVPRDVGQIMQKFIPPMLKGVESGAAVTVAEARTLVPVETGELQGSIRRIETVILGPIVRATVAATAHHASFVEYGTGLVGQANPHPPLPIAGVPYTGRWIYDFRRQNWIGMAARPYMRPAIDNTRRELVDAVAEAFRAAGYNVRTFYV